MKAERIITPDWEGLCLLLSLYTSSGYRVGVKRQHGEWTLTLRH